MGDPARRTPTVLLVDDHPVFRRGLYEVVRSRFRVVAEASNGAEALRAVEQLRPDIVVLDVALPGIGGLAICRQIKEQSPKTQVVVLTAADDDETLFEAIRSGACAFLWKEERMETILSALESAAEGESYLPPTVATRVMGGTARLMRGDLPLSDLTSDLTPRELQVLQLMAKGLRNRDIAEALSISERTAANHIANVYSKFGVQDRASAIVAALKLGIISI